jgi:hypothetical protein
VETPAPATLATAGGAPATATPSPASLERAAPRVASGDRREAPRLEALRPAARAPSRAALEDPYARGGALKDPFE